MISFLLRVGDASSTSIRGVSSVAMMVLWINVFNYLRAFRKLSSVSGLRWVAFAGTGSVCV